MFNYTKLFARNYLLFTEEQMKRLRQTRCLVLGVGAMGGVATFLLARAGVEQFVLVDFDRFEAHNMNRQPGCVISTIGQGKADVVARMLEEVNPGIEAEVVNERISRKVLKKFLGNTDVVLFTADQAAFRNIVLLNNAPAYVIWSFAIGSIGVVATVEPQGSCSLVEFTGLPQRPRKVWSALREEAGFTDEWWQNMEGGKVTPATWGVATWVLGSLMTSEAVKLVTGKWKPIVAPKFWLVRPASVSVETVDSKGVVASLIQVCRRR